MEYDSVLASVSMVMFALPTPPVPEGGVSCAALIVAWYCKIVALAAPATSRPAATPKINQERETLFRGIGASPMCCGVDLRASGQGGGRKIVRFSEMTLVGR